MHTNYSLLMSQVHCVSDRRLDMYCCGCLDNTMHGEVVHSYLNNGDIKGLLLHLVYVS